MKPSERIKRGVFHFGAAWDMSEAFLNLLDYLDELHDQRERGPELWAVVAVDAKGTTVRTDIFTHRSRAESHIDASPEFPGLTLRLVRFVGEWVDEEGTKT